MGENTQKQDFIEVEYTGFLTDGLVFDTTDATVAQKHNLSGDEKKFGSMIICVGERQILPGLEAKLVGKEVGKEYKITLPPEEAFGRREVQKIKIIPLDTFKEHKLQPYPGLQVNVDGEVGIVTRVTGGRIMINFNHPLAGKEVIYEVKIKRKITDPAEKLKSYLETSFRMPKDTIKVEAKDTILEATLPLELPVQVMKVLEQKLTELIMSAVKIITLEKKK